MKRYMTLIKNRKCAYITSFVLTFAFLLVFMGMGEAMEDTTRQEERTALVNRTIVARGVIDLEVIKAMLAVPRHRFVPQAYRHDAYIDAPLSIGHGQTISQPYIVALMTELMAVDSTSKVLEIGTGSGYQAAVLGEIVDYVYTIGIVCPLADRAKAILDTLDYDNIYVLCGDGYQGWPEHAPNRQSGISPSGRSGTMS